MSRAAWRVSHWVARSAERLAGKRALPMASHLVVPWAVLSVPMMAERMVVQRAGEKDYLSVETMDGPMAVKMADNLVDETALTTVDSMAERWAEWTAPKTADM